jgi:hypothetical protein
MGPPITGSTRRGYDLIAGRRQVVDKPSHRMFEAAADDSHRMANKPSGVHHQPAADEITQAAVIYPSADSTVAGGTLNEKQPAQIAVLFLWLFRNGDMPSGGSNYFSTGAGRIRLQFGVPRRRRGGSQLQFDATHRRRVGSRQNGPTSSTCSAPDLRTTEAGVARTVFPAAAHISPGALGQ